MKYTTKELERLKALLSPLGEITFKPHFSFLGIFKEDTMFALYKDQNLYVRKSMQYLEEIAQTISIHFLVDRHISNRSKIFYLLPPSILNNLQTYSHWISSAILEYQQSKAKIENQNQNKIRMLPNLNVSIERLLAKVGIYTVTDLKTVGAINVFVRLIQQGLEATALLLFKLYSAIQYKYIYMLTEQEKQDLLIEADNALYQAGLRKRFIP
ncbi:TfoX/Sxy family DNA transformation protein [Actinobacillus equuli]|uniref:TfoX/Sxy family DNA transformation protein n=1 Tax=Actinobacillus equuli TaxID=718 RepID=UPI0024419406|nr:TfoX/Sxy family DNA transformation protein [Actinobacillus equuli]WGE46153.1 TfoX/Sxy family DNA transformation protein [Actinobacillus equuli subsp. haemolyticus]WGE52509.1 TfoX/Sxy family DNA transformation protein [Actinobacillus equuli subsp. haemolyticus]WGE72951.1 TfoX/Sxy family DNA transformation protein [Actinobacillus equuli subsp. haemolyticus]WGE76922.1 TfoX/Sxy family DNA transformation protein [Actinobacillus equuli subsp. haemolyticus]